MINNFKKILILFSWSSIVLLIIRVLISFEDINSMINNIELWKLTYSFFSYAGEAICVSTLLQLLYEKYLWKFKFLNFWKVPVLSKKYNGTFYSSFDKKNHNAELEIRQTFLFINVVMKTSESRSNSINAEIHDENGSKILTYTFLNEPSNKYYEKSKMHYGTASLICDNPNLLKGNYYTSRETIGSMTFSSKKKKIR